MDLIWITLLKDSKPTEENPDFAEAMGRLHEFFGDVHHIQVEHFTATGPLLRVRQKSFSQVARMATWNVLRSVTLCVLATWRNI